MPITQDRDDLPNDPGPNAPLPSEQTMLSKPLIDAWWIKYVDSGGLDRASAMPELPLRASMMGLRCDRALWYAISKTPETDPSGVSNVWRMNVGKLIHDQIADTMAPNEYDDDGNKHGWWSEDVTDLRVIGYPGSSHADLILYDHGKAVMLNETKTVGGFKFKKTTTRFGGGPLGPEWAHIMQAVLSAKARDVPTVVIFYLAPENVSADIAKSNHLDEYRKFSAEWHFEVKDYEDDLRQEIKRQVRVQSMTEPDGRGNVWLPERTLNDPSVPGGAMVVKPETGAWVVISPVDGTAIKAGTKWFCGYCNHRKKCIEDGPEMREISVTLSSKKEE